MGKGLILIGLGLILAGVLISLGPRTGWLGKLPGDLWLKKENFSFYFPVTTCVLVSIVLTLIMNFFRK